MRTLLAYTAAPAHDNQTGDDFEALLPIGLCSLHALLCSQNIPVTLANFTGMTDQAAATVLRSLSPDVVGLSQWTHNRHETIHMARLVKKTLPGCIVILGGGHATHQADLILQQHPEVDLIVIGEAERTLPELLEALRTGDPLHDIPGLALRINGTPQRTSHRPALNELDSLPFPSSHLHKAINIDCALQAEFISTSRGCPANCRFCASPSFWGRRVRYRSARSVADEMLFIREQYGLIYLSLRDDTFTADRRRTVALCRELIDRQVHIFWNCQSRVEAIDAQTLEWMRKAGCECVQLGVESGSEHILQMLGKRITPEQIIQAADLIHNAGMHLSVYLISGIPEENNADRQQTINLVKKIRPDDLQIAPLAYYPGTALFDTAVSAGLLPAGLFESNLSRALLAQRDGQQQVDRLLARTARYRHTNTAENLSSIQQRQGFSAVTAMMAGDQYTAEGNMKAAENQYLLMTANESDHPWGWYLLGELYEQQQKKAAAVRCYRKVLDLIPLHGPSSEGLRRLKH